MEVNKFSIAQALDKEIDSIKSKMSSKKKYSREWRKLNKALQKTYHKREEQIENVLYEMSHYIAKRYNVVIIGDYTPSKDVAPYKNMRRSMLNQTFIGSFRRILQHVCWKYGTEYILVDETDTTKTCCITKTKKKRPPEERSWIVNSRLVLGDINSAVNIARKAGKNLDVNKINLSSIDVYVKMSYRDKLKINNCLARATQDDSWSELTEVAKSELFYSNTW